MRLVSHLPYQIRVRTRSGQLVEVERVETASINVKHRGTGRLGLYGPAGEPLEVAIREACWADDVDLPPPVPGVARVVSTHVAELAVLAGRPHHDLFVALQGYGADGAARVYKALCPAASASPALRALLALEARHAPEEADAGAL